MHQIYSLSKSISSRHRCNFLLWCLPHTVYRKILAKAKKAHMTSNTIPELLFATDGNSCTFSRLYELLDISDDCLLEFLNFVFSLFLDNFLKVTWKCTLGMLREFHSDIKTKEESSSLLWKKVRRVIEQMERGRKWNEGAIKSLHMYQRMSGHYSHRYE